MGQLTDDDMTVIEGKRDQLVGKIRERYGYAKDQAEKEVSDWERKRSPLVAVSVNELTLCYCLPDGTRRYRQPRFPRGDSLSGLSLI